MNNKKTGIVFATLSILIWSTHATSGKLLLQNKFYWSLPFFRFAMAWLATWCISFFFKESSPKPVARSHKSFLFALLLGVIPNILLFHGALFLADAGSTMILENTAPLFVFTINLLFFSKRINLKSVLSLLLIVLAMGVVLHDSPKELAWIQGSFFGVLAGLTWAIYMVAIDKESQKLSHIGDRLAHMKRLFFWASLICLPGVFIDTPPLTTQYWLNLAYYSVFPTAVAFILWNEAISKLSSSTTSILFTFTIVLTVFFASFILGETPTPAKLAGAIIITVAVVLDNLQFQLLQTSIKDKLRFLAGRNIQN